MTRSHPFATPPLLLQTKLLLGCANLHALDRHWMPSGSPQACQPRCLAVWDIAHAASGGLTSLRGCSLDPLSRHSSHVICIKMSFPLRFMTQHCDNSSLIIRETAAWQLFHDSSSLQVGMAGNAEACQDCEEEDAATHYCESSAQALPATSQLLRHKASLLDTRCASPQHSDTLT